VRRVIRVNPDGRYELNHEFFDFLSADGNLFRPAFRQLFGAPRDWRNPLPFDALDDHFDGRVSDEDRHYADLAASVQFVIEEAVLALARRAHHLTKADNLCIAGGVALNAVANSRVIRDGPFAEVFIPPDPGDGGGALGAAMLEYCQSTGGRPVTPVRPWLGRPSDSTVVEGIVANADPAEWNAYTADPDRTREAREELDSKQFANFEELLDCVVDDLMAGRIVGWIQGRFELGPRALGNRSILTDPGNLASVKRLSERVKRRARFRPYALSLCEEDFTRIFSVDSDRPRSNGNGGIPSSFRWMQTVRRVRDEVEPLVRGAIHHDRRTRLQICSAQDNPRFHALLTTFGKRRGLGALLNTSFNEPGYPMVATPAEGLLMFARTDMDVLVMNDLVVRRKRYVENAG
jgi:carbamoyltransferase